MNTVERYRGTDKLIARFRAGGRVHDRELLREIGYARNGYVFQHVVDESGVRYALIRPELLEIIALKLAPSAVSQDKATRAKRAKAQPTHDQWQVRADKIWTAHPSWSASRVGTEIAKAIDGKADTIRKAIKKK